jgi:hypothetical protein
MKLMILISSYLLGISSFFDPRELLTLLTGSSPLATPPLLVTTYFKLNNTFLLVLRGASNIFTSRNFENLFTYRGGGVLYSQVRLGFPQKSIAISIAILSFSESLDGSGRLKLGTFRSFASSIDFFDRLYSTCSMIPRSSSTFGRRSASLWTLDGLTMTNHKSQSSHESSRPSDRRQTSHRPRASFDKEQALIS